MHSTVTPVLLLRRISTLCLVEMQKIRHDRTELWTRAIQPTLWLVVFGNAFDKIRAIPTGGIPYIDFLVPGVLAQSVLFISIFYGIQVIWERDAGLLAKLLVTPTPRLAVVAGKAFASGIRSMSQVIVIIVLSLIMGISIDHGPFQILGAFAIVILTAVFFTCLSIILAGILLSRDRLMGIGQAITMPIFFASNALYPISLMPQWLKAISRVNPLTYSVDGLRNLIIGTQGHLLVDFGVLGCASVAAIITAASLLGRLAR